MAQIMFVVRQTNSFCVKGDILNQCTGYSYISIEFFKINRRSTKANIIKLFDTNNRGIIVRGQISKSQVS